jgi:hypothetical protein
MQHLLSEVKRTNEQAASCLQKCKDLDVPSVDDEYLVDMTDIIKSFKLRSEIERAFFFHLFYDILRDQFGLKGNGPERDIFERQG